MEVLYYSSLFRLTRSLLNLGSFVTNLALLRLRVFGGHFWPKFCGEGHKNIVDWGVVRVGVELLQISKLFSIWFKL